MLTNDQLNIRTNLQDAKIETLIKIVNNRFIDEQIEHVIDKYTIAGLISMLITNVKKEEVPLFNHSMIKHYGSVINHIIASSILIETARQISISAFSSFLNYFILGRVIRFIELERPHIFDNWIKNNNEFINYYKLARIRVEESYNYAAIFICVMDLKGLGYDINTERDFNYHITDSIQSEAKNIVTERGDVNILRYFSLFHLINENGQIDSFKLYGY